MLPDQVRTERLWLRRPRRGDGGALAEAVRESLPDLSPWLKWADRLERVGLDGPLDARVAAAVTGFEAACDPSWYVWSADHDVLAGEVTLRTEERELGVLEYVVWIRSSLAGRGVASEASLAVLNIAFEHLGAEIVEAGCHARNHRSRRLLASLGFTRWGVKGDLDRYILFPVAWARVSRDRAVRSARAGAVAR